MSQKPTIHFVSLGCPKNRVDSEVMLGVAQGAGYRHVPDAEDASVVVVNTCGFIEAAKQESVDTILELGRLKASGSCKKLVVAGCLSQRYPDDLAAGMPEVDHFLGSSDMMKLGKVLRGGAARNLVGNPADWVIDAASPRSLSTRGASAYLKLAEGCNRSCSFCVIPGLRGKQRSRTPSDIVAEARQLVERGVLELNLVSQDTVSYGRDLKDGSGLSDVVEQVADIPGVKWVRLFYLYPEKLDTSLIELLGQHERVLPYVDMPLQHAADPMLKRMRRGHGGARLRQLVERLRKGVPDLVFRTAFIVGHPGESQSEFDELCEFVNWAEFDRVGVFRYSDEEGCKSKHLEDKVSGRDSYNRARKLMSLQRTISKRKNRALVGRDLEVLVEGPSEEHEWVMEGRHRGQAPDIDGSVFLSGGPVLPGEMHLARVVQTSDYDLVAEVADGAEPIALPRIKPQPTAAGFSHHSSDGRRVSLRTVS